MTSRTPQLTARDRTIANRIAAGETYAPLIEEYGLSRVQLWRIARTYGVRVKMGRPRKERTE